MYFVSNSLPFGAQAFLVFNRVLFVLLCVAPAPFFVASLSFFWRNANLAGRFAGRLCCWVFVLGWLGHDSPHLKPQCFILFVQLLPLLSPSGPSLRARSATTEGEKKVFNRVFQESVAHRERVFVRSLEQSSLKIFPLRATALAHPGHQVF